MAGDGSPSAKTTGVSARPVGAGLGAGRDRPPGARQGEEAREGLAADPAPRRRLPGGGVEDWVWVPAFCRAGGRAAAMTSASRQNIFQLIL